MFYEPGKTDHGLSKNPFNSLIIPRPIGWISSIDGDGVVNLATYSFFNAVSYRPPTVMFAASRGTSSPDDNNKDTQRNIEETGEFVCNLTTWDTREAMNATSAGFTKVVSFSFPSWLRVLEGGASPSSSSFGLCESCLASAWATPFRNSTS